MRIASKEPGVFSRICNSWSFKYVKCKVCILYKLREPFIIKVLIPRSLCLLKLGQGKAALDDVLEALKAGYPEENR